MTMWFSFTFAVSQIGWQSAAAGIGFAVNLKIKFSTTMRRR
jgi:hypothetical protein